jgi:dTDP-4-amino-4,6-dideoxygalactose transaminase
MTPTVKKNVPFLDLKQQYRTIQDDVNVAIHEVLERGDFILGKAVGEFEQAFADYCEVPYAVGADSGYSAIELILRAYGIGPGDEVITAANTFISTVFPVANCGARTVMVDIDPDIYNIDPARIEAAITPATKAIIVVHLYGQPADVDPVLEIAKRHNLVVIEDACQAHGARYKGRRTGSLGHAAAFSFYPGKNLGAYGDGGALVTSDADIAERARLLRNLGQPSKNHHTMKGFNFRLDTIQAAILGVKLPHLDAWNASRRRNAAHYDRLLGDLPVVAPPLASNVEHVYHLYVIRVQNRAELQQHLQEAGVATGIHYPTPIHLQPAFQDLGYQRGDFPIAEAYADQILSLPMFPELQEDQIAYVAEIIKENALAMA